MQLLLNRAVAWCCGLVCAALVAGTARAEWYTDQQEKMGTSVSIQVWLPDDGAAAVRAAELLHRGMAEFDRIEAQMSTYIESSEMSRINRLAASGPQSVTPELFALLIRAQEISELTEGAFDISYDSVGQLYDFRAGLRPDEAEIAAQLPAINYRNIVLDPEQQTVEFAVPGVRINLGGIAKGYAVEQVIELLAEAGVKHALANAGGDTRILGDRVGKPWIVGVRDPNDARAIFTRMALADEAISTSGDYERFFVEDGQRYHHIISPSSGVPATGVRSVSVVGPNATVTDALSTSVFVMGPERGLKLIAELTDYEALVITDEEYFYSAGLSPD
ncbi:MAG: FAD:protein FMN transferase [Gammaproteobacteria bacterium]|jgi:thiamine biosynthesis lipoprotein|nr:FAD:protein FMN transferase [Gammaproteobacteria bacterium]